MLAMGNKTRAPWPWPLLHIVQHMTVHGHDQHFPSCFNALTCQQEYSTGLDFD